MLLHLLKEGSLLRLLVLVIVLGMSESAFVLWQIGYVKEVFDAAASGNRGLLVESLLMLGLLILATTAIRNAAVYCHDLFTVRFRNSMSICLFDRFLSSEHRGAKELHSGDVMSRIVQDIGSVTAFLADTFPRILSNVILLTGAFAYFCFINFKIALCIVTLTPLFLLCGRLFLRKSDFYMGQVRGAETEAQSLLQETIQNKVLVKLNRTVDYVIHKYANLADRMEQTVCRRTRYIVRMNFLMSAGFSAVYMVTMAWGCLLLADGAITLGEMAAILQLTDRIQNPARSLSDLIPQCAGFMVSRRRLQTVYQMAGEVGDVVSLTPPLGIGFERVTFSYAADNEAVLRDFSFTFKPGSFTVVKGESGVGKTTLVSLALALYKPQQGEVCVFGADKKIPVTAGVRDYIEYVPQGNSLLSGTIKDNLRLGNPEATQRDMEEALRMACATFVLARPDGLSTVCAEQGGGLSEGQKQRIVIARALLRKRPILILDEATSALDEATERMVMRNLRTMTSKTVIFITHKRHLEAVGDDVLTLRHN